MVWIIVSNQNGYFHTDVAAMTTTDWVGTIFTIVIFVLMVVAYFQVFRPKNRDKLESYRNMALDDEKTNRGEKHGG